MILAYQIILLLIMVLAFLFVVSGEERVRTHSGALCAVAMLSFIASLLWL